MKCIAAVLVLVSTVAAVEPSTEVKPAEKNVTYRAYWLTDAESAAIRGYQTLLVMPWPMEKLSGYKRESDMLFDGTAMTFRTYLHDSLWDSPFKPVQQCTAVDVDAKTVTLDSAAYRYEVADIKDVVLLLENPLGKQPLHRRVAPLQGAEQTAKAFRLLLEDQIKSEKK